MAENDDSDLLNFKSTTTIRRSCTVSVPHKAHFQLDESSLVKCLQTNPSAGSHCIQHPLIWRLQSEQKMFLDALWGRDILTRHWNGGSQKAVIRNIGTRKWGHIPKRGWRVIFRWWLTNLVADISPPSPGSISREPLWGVWQGKRYSSGFPPPVSTIPQMHHTYSFVCHEQYASLASGTVVT